MAAGGTPETFFGGNGVGLATFRRVAAALASAHPDVTVRVSKSQIAFRRRRGFAYLWVPGRYLRGSPAPVVLSIASRNRLASERFKEVVHPGPWMHHLEVSDESDIDDEVTAWLEQAAEEAGSSR
jgi:hypothetical protein